MATQQDYEHAAFVKEEYRYVTITDASVKANNASAIVIELDTTLNQADATALANKIMAASTRARTFEVTVQGIYYPDSILGGPPSFIPGFPKLATDGRTMTVVSKTTVYEKELTTFTIRG